MLLSVLYVRFRDVAIIWVVVAQVLFYATPVLYPITILKDARPRTAALDQPAGGRSSSRSGSGCSNPTPRPPSEAAGGAVHLLPAVAIFVGVCVFGVWVFNREAPRIAEEL